MLFFTFNTPVGHDSFCKFVKLSLNDIILPFYCTMGLSEVRQANRLRFSQLVARGEATPLRGLRGVRNADDWPVGST